MKKITFLAILMASYITNSQIILSEDFETTTIDQGFVNGWTVESEDALPISLPDDVIAHRD